MSLVKHSILNLGGNFIPAIVTLPAYGYLARALGVESFSIYTLAIIVIGYAGIFDAGLTRAVIREIALYRTDKIEQKKIISCGTVSILSFGVVAMSFMAISAPLIIDTLNVTVVMKAEAISAVSILALSIPIFLLNQIWLSILEGNENFLQLNVQRSIGSIFIAGMPVLFVTLKSGIFSAVLGLFVARIIALVISGIMVKDEIISAGLKFDKLVFKRLISFGGWSALTGIISPVMVYFDRFILANMLGAKYVALYSMPAELITKGLIIPGAFVGSLFPKLINEKNENERKKLKYRAYKIIFSICGAGVLLGCFLAEKVMVLWMGDEFKGTPVIVLKILLVGFFFNSIAQVAFSDIQAKGKSKITATVHLIEVLPYLTILYFLINSYGVVGAAIAWSLRLTCESFCFIFISEKLKK
ncbi:flippase [Aeromonas veronii]